jgi:type IV pilus assembly protein PilW
MSDQGVDTGVQIGCKPCGERRFGTLSRKGFALLELLVAVCAALVMFGIIVGTFTFLEEGYDLEAQIADMQHRLAVGIRTMTKELPMAGNDPSGTAGAGLVAADSNTIRFTMDLNGDGDVSDADEDITYTLDTGQLQLKRNGQALVKNIPPEGLLFSYFDSSGHELNSTPLNAAARDMVSRITVQLTARTAEPDPNYPKDGGYRTKTLQSDVLIRNLSISSTPMPATTATTATPMPAATATGTTTPGTTTGETTAGTPMTAQTTTSETTTPEHGDRKGL